jgi:hypothetical protein
MLNPLRNWLRLRDLERDLDRELQYHVERRIDDLVRAGVPLAEARQRAAPRRTRRREGARL